MLRVLVKQPSESYQLLILKGKRITAVSSEFRLLLVSPAKRAAFRILMNDEDKVKNAAKQKFTPSTSHLL